MFTLFKENLVNSAIPDQGNLSNSINVYRQGKLQGIKVHVNVSHSYVGDLSLKLTSPSGTEVTLQSRKGGSSDDLEMTYEGEILESFLNEDCQGLWTLMVEDNAPRDSGTLNSWGLDLAAEEFGHYRSEIFIPDAASENVLISTQESRFIGKVTAAEAEVEIDHPIIGDLIVSIVSPSGQEIVVHNRTGGSQKTLKAHYTSTDLAGFKGDDSGGTWTLKVKNFDSSDTGIVKHWKIKFNYEQVDDLKRIEGVGPKIEKLLHNAGIYSFTGLAVAPIEEVKNALLAGGDRFKMHEPTTWSRQASLAAQNRWEELEELQDALDGGKEVVA